MSIQAALAELETIQNKLIGPLSKEERMLVKDLYDRKVMATKRKLAKKLGKGIKDIYLIDHPHESDEEDANEKEIQNAT